jgi:hypothetical protein
MMKVVQQASSSSSSSRRPISDNDDDNEAPSSVIHAPPGFKELVSVVPTYPLYNLSPHGGESADISSDKNSRTATTITMIKGQGQAVHRTQIAPPPPPPMATSTHHRLPTTLAILILLITTAVLRRVRQTRL